MNTTAYNQFAKEIANYINYHCDGVDEGFEIEYEGFTAFVSYKAEIREDAGDYWTAPSWWIERETVSVEGVYNEDGEIVPELFPNEAQARIEELEQEGDYLSGTARFLRGAVKACRSGVRRSHLISYQEDGALLQELFSRDGIGTQIVMESAEQIRRATINDIGGILDLIAPLEQQGILVRRSREQLEMEIDKFTIIQRDNTTIACAALYPFPEEKIGEMACVAVHPDYRSSSRGEVLLERIAAQAKQMGLNHLFVLTTRSIHWFQERGFKPVDVELLPESKKQLYNYQRRSKVLMTDLA